MGRKKSKTKTIFKITTIVVTILLVIFIIYGLQLGIFRDKDLLVDKIRTFGVWGPLVFLLLQAFQVMFPVIPGGASCLAGVLAFGPVFGFIYNYVGLTLGSIGAFYLSRTLGMKIVQAFFEQKTIDKYLAYVRTNTFKWIFFWGILVPGLPDDLLCYVAGLSNMKFRTFIWIILVGKPLSLLGYSLFVHLL